MELNETDKLSQTLLYMEIKKYFVWNKEDRIWTRRKQGVSIGCIHHVPPSWGEYFYLHVLLNKVNGPKTFDEIKTYDKVVYPTFKEACYARGLLDDDQKYIEGLH
jgi:hypothetical protein